MRRGGDYRKLMTNSHINIPVNKKSVRSLHKKLPIPSILHKFTQPNSFTL
jgi:hypothetical protein